MFERAPIFYIFFKNLYVATYSSYDIPHQLIAIFTKLQVFGVFIYFKHTSV